MYTQAGNCKELVYNSTLVCLCMSALVYNFQCCVLKEPGCAAVVADSVIGIFYGDF